jgi:hypothetical protein
MHSLPAPTVRVCCPGTRVLLLVGGPEQTLLVVHSDIKILRSPGVAISSRRADLDDLKELSGRTRVRPGARKPVVRRAARHAFCTDPVAYLHTHVYPAR